MEENNNIPEHFLAILGNKCDVEDSEWQITSDMVENMKQNINLEDRVIY